MKSDLFGTLLAAGEVPAILPISDVRAAMSGTIKACNDLAGVLNDGPVKVKFLETATSLGTVLAGLPKDDAKPETIEASKIVTDLVGSLTSATAVILQAQTTIGSMRAGMAEDMQASLTRHVASEIAAGRLHTHADHVAAVDAAKMETHAGCVGHLQGYRSRMSMCASGPSPVPLPGEDVLNPEKLPDDKWKPRHEQAVARCKVLEPLGIKGDQLRTLAWDSDKDIYDTVVSAIGSKKVVPLNPYERSGAKNLDGARARQVAALC